MRNLVQEVVNGRKSHARSSGSQPVCCPVYPPRSVPPPAPLSLSPRSLTLTRLPFLLCLSASAQTFQPNLGKISLNISLLHPLPLLLKSTSYGFHCPEVTRDFSMVEVEGGTESGEFPSSGACLFQPLLHMYHAKALPGALHESGTRVPSGYALVCASNVPAQWQNTGN